MIEREDAVNWSTLKEFRSSPRHYRHLLTVPRQDTDALMRGRVTHCLIYEPTAYDERYIEEPRFHRGWKDETAIKAGYDGGKETAAEWDRQVMVDDLEVVPGEIAALSRAIASSVRSDPIAGAMVTGGYSEQLITWTDPETGIECRGRVDHVNGRLSDLKTTADLARFANQVVKYGYHGQMAYYLDGLAANGILLDSPPALIAVEAKQPHDVVVYELGQDVIDAGRALYRYCLAQLALCRETDSWPGRAGGSIVPLALPDWAMPKLELTMGGEGFTI